MFIWFSGTFVLFSFSAFSLSENNHNYDLDVDVNGMNKLKVGAYGNSNVM